MQQKEYDFAVIGGGPAGMLAAITAGQQGQNVVLLEKNDRLGKKLLITGKGRCNITNAEENQREFLEKFGKNGKFLYTALNNFGVADTLKYFNDHGIKTKVERGQRVFPVSDKASDVLKLLEHNLKKAGVTVLLNTRIEKIISKDNIIEKILLTDKKAIFAKKYLIATGGLSYPSTGSTGEGHKWLKELGHTVIKPTPSLTPILVQGKWIKWLQGLSLKNVTVAIYQNSKKQDERFGEALFTHEGLSGPIILDMSKKIGELLANGKVELFIDFKPALDYQKLDNRLLRDFQENQNKNFKNSLNNLLPQKLIPMIIKLSGIDPELKTHSITKGQRKILLHLLKKFKLQVTGLSGFEKAIITTGGISLKEIDPKTMQSKLFKNLYLAGEILNLDGPTGGYNLQVCWSTGYLAGLCNS